LRISRSHCKACAGTSSFDKNNGFDATMCIARDEPTDFNGSNEAPPSSTSNVIKPAIRPSPIIKGKNASKKKHQCHLNSYSTQHECPMRCRIRNGELNWKNILNGKWYIGAYLKY
jgi:hypothetical protein